MLDTLPGEKIQYSSWTEQVDGLKRILGSARRVAMQYSPLCAIPYVAMVDAGTVELVRGLGVEVATSAELIQHFEARWTCRRRWNRIWKRAAAWIACARAAFRTDWRADRQRGLGRRVGGEAVRAGGVREGGLFTDRTGRSSALTRTPPIRTTSRRKE